MPNRIIKESINESKGLSEVSSFSQDFYKRLITYADDYGRFNSDPPIIRARLYPRELIAVIEEDIIDALVELSAIDKVRLYVGENERVDGVFGYFPRWPDHQRVRNSREKWPEPGVDEVNDWYLRRFVPMKMKIFLYERDKFICQECGKDFSLPNLPTKRAIRLLDGAMHIDHIVPVSAGGRATEENLRILCASCNLHRPRSVDLEEAVRTANGGKSRQVAAKRKKVRPESNPIQSNPNPNPIQEIDFTETDILIDYLNEKASTSFRHSQHSREHIHARLVDGFTVDDCKLVIDHKAMEWLGDAKTAEWVNPRTLFAPTKIEKNVNAARRWAENGRKRQTDSKDRTDEFQHHDPSIYDRGRKGGE